MKITHTGTTGNDVIIKILKYKIPKHIKVFMDENNKVCYKQHPDHEVDHYLSIRAFNVHAIEEQTQPLVP